MNHSFAFTFGGIMMLAFFALFIFSVPSAHAAEENARLGGGNALLRATSGISHANPVSDILSRLTFASTRGGMPEEVPPPSQGSGGESASNTGGNVGGGGEGSPGDSAPESVNTNGGGEGGNNGGASSGNGGDGGNGGNASPGGLVRAGDVVTNATALNAINVNILRISLSVR